MVEDKICHLRQEQWYPKSFSGVLRTFFPVGEQALNPLREYWGDAYTCTVFFSGRGHILWFWSGADMKRLANDAVTKFISTPQTFQRLVTEWRRRAQAFEQVVSQMRRKSPRSLSDTELVSVHDRVYQSYIAQYSLAIGLQDAISMLDTLNVYIMPELLRGKSQRKATSEYAELWMPSSQSFSLQVELALLRAALYIHEYPEFLELVVNAESPRRLAEILQTEQQHGALFQELAERFYWVGNSYRVHHEMTAGNFLALAKQRLVKKRGGTRSKLEIQAEIETTSNRSRERASARTEILENLGPQARSAAAIAAQITEIADQRKRLVFIANGFFGRIFTEVSRRTELEQYQLDNLLPVEIAEALLQKSSMSEELTERDKGCLCIQDSYGHTLVVGQKAKMLLERHFRKRTQSSTELSGSPASPGIARGEVFLVHTQEDAQAMPKGRVLVATMTRPEFLPAIVNAGAIVTDEGGLASHAAVLSRERDIPCVLGTRYATELLENGVNVEVDANQGLVKIISGEL